VKVGKDVVSCIASRLEEQQKQWRERHLKEKGYPCLYLKAKVLVAEYRRHSNYQQPHSALGYQTPASSGLWASQTWGCGPYKELESVTVLSLIEAGTENGVSPHESVL
jgi:hypothetical protein